MVCREGEGGRGREGRVVCREERVVLYDIIQEECHIE